MQHHCHPFRVSGLGSDVMLLFLLNVVVAMVAAVMSATARAAAAAAAAAAGGPAVVVVLSIVLVIVVVSAVPAAADHPPCRHESRKLYHKSTPHQTPTALRILCEVVEPLIPKSRNPKLPKP